MQLIMLNIGNEYSRVIDMDIFNIVFYRDKYKDHSIDIRGYVHVVL